MTKEQLLLQYKKAMKSFCKEYRSFYIPASQNVEELQENNRNKGISMINVFTPLSVVPLKEDRKGKDDSMEAGFDVDEVLRNIDRKIYELDLEELKEKKEIEVEETSIPIFLVGVKNLEKEALPEGEEKDFYILEYQNGPLDPEIHQISVKAADSVISDYKESTFCLLKGARVRKNGFEYLLLEPEEWKNESKDSVESEKEESENLISIPGKIILSSPGGGKTTLLQMLTYAFLDHEMLPEFKKEEAEDCVQLREKLEIEEKGFPVFIRIRDLAEELLSKTEECPEFEKIILWAMQSFVKGEDNHEKWEEILSEIMEQSSLVLLIDGIDELESSRQEQFLQKLTVYLEHHRENLLYISARHANYQDNEINHMLQPYYIEEYVIESLANNYALVETFARNWYQCVFEHDKKKQRTVETAFLRPIKNDPNLQKLITNPLELTNLLIISSGEGYLPTDRNQIYEGAIELQLKWNHSRNLDLVDVEFQLAYLAYQMSESTSERIIIGESRLIDIISEARQELKRYFRTKQSLEREEIKDFIHYIVGNTCILQKSSSLFGGSEPQYEFHHLQYQAFLTAFCITKGLFSKKKRKAEKFDYIEGYLNKMDDIWSQVIVLAAMQDIHLRDDIIEALLRISRENKNQNQSVSMLLQLMAVPGINFDSEEKQIVAELLVKEDTNRLDLLRNKREDIQWMLLNNTVSENKDFISALLYRAERTEGVKKEKYLEQIASIIFFVIWECSVDEEDIRRVMESCFKNWITIDIMTQIKNTFLRGKENKNTISIINKMGVETLELMKEDEERATDYFMIIANIYCHQEGKNPYETMREKLLSDNQTDKLIGVNLLFLLAWMHQMNKQELLNAPRAVPEKRMEDIRPVLLDAMKKNDYMTYDYEATYRDILQNGMVDRIAPRWYPEDIFHMECQKIFKMGEITGEERAVEVLANYPLNRRTLRMAEKEQVPERTLELLKKCLDSGKDQIKIKAFKILVFLYSHEDKEQKMKFYFEALKRKFWALESYTGGARVKGEVQKEFEKLVLEVGELCLEDKKWYTENPGRQYYLDGDPMKAADAFTEDFDSKSSKMDLAFLLRRCEIRNITVKGEKIFAEELLSVDEAELDAFGKINQALLKHDNFNNINQAVVDALLMTSFKANYVEAVLWWKHLLNKGDPEGAKVIYALYCAAQKYICEEDVKKAQEIIRFQSELRELKSEERLFIYTDENGERMTGKTVLEFEDTKTGEKYLLYRKNALLEKIIVSAAKFRMNGDEGTMVLPENERDQWAVEAIWDIVRQRLSQ